MSLIIKFKLLHKDAKVPVRLPGDAGWDLSLLSYSFIDGDAGRHMLHTGVAVEIPPGYFGLLRPRSSICKTGYMFVSSGVIDSSYRGEIGVPVKWNGSSKYENGDRIAQLIILPLPDVSFVQVDKLSESVRGEGGFGSTGK